MRKKTKIFELKRATSPVCNIGLIWAIYKDNSRKFICYSLELPYLSNEPFISCVPPGDYTMTKEPRFTPFCFRLINHNLGVGNNKGDCVRWGIDMHAANKLHELQGCIAPGLKLNNLEYGVLDSRKAIFQIKSFMMGNEATLRIV